MTTYKSQDGTQVAELPTPMTEYDFVEYDQGKRMRVTVEIDVPLGECDRGVYVGTRRGGLVMHALPARLVMWKRVEA